MKINLTGFKKPTDERKLGKKHPVLPERKGKEKQV